MILGKASEHLVASKLLDEEREIYLPLVDDHGVDLIVRTIQPNNSDQFQEVQIKSLSTGGLFAAITCNNPKPNYWFVFYVKDIDTMWLINSIDFVQLASPNRKGKNIGKYSLSVAGKKGPSVKCANYIVTDFSTLP